MHPYICMKRSPLWKLFPYLNGNFSRLFTQQKVARKSLTPYPHGEENIFALFVPFCEHNLYWHTIPIYVYISIYVFIKAYAFYFISDSFKSIYRSFHIFNCRQLFRTK